ncbi:WxL protein peptidoglycan domain-containing protein [Mumia sp. DW29H23]|uniref:WxL protein peptidoglycan domain-containing protein n=1 Tax=Mumia sp. DW29H23 TaxID=3421241 RepID=UPI003D68B8F1
MTLAKRLVRPLLALLVLVVATAVLPAPAHAADNGAWSVSPTPADESSPTPRSYFVLEGAPGATLTDKVRIRNFTKNALTFSIYGADGYNTEEGGFFALRSLEHPQNDVGAWVKLPVQQVKVARRTQVDVPITIQIPPNATPGDHVGGIVALNGAVEGTTESGGIDVGIKRAVAARLYLRVSGPATPAVKVSDIRLDHDRGIFPWSGQGKGTVSYTVENTGNLRLSPTAVISLSGLGGRELDKVETAAVVDLLPGQTAKLKQKVDGIAPLDRVTVDVALTTPVGIGDADAVTQWVVPWIAVIAVLLALAAGAWWWWRRRVARKRAFEAVASAPKLTIAAGR